MQFSHRFTVAVHVLLCIAEFSGVEKTTSNFLARSVNVNPVVIRQVLGQLKDAGLVKVEAGVGGATLAMVPREISLWDVFRAVEKSEEPLFHFHDNPNPACPVGRVVHAVMDQRLEDVKASFARSLKDVTLASLINDMKKEMGAN